MSRLLPFCLNRVVAVAALAGLVIAGMGCDLGGGGANSVTISGRVVDASANPVQGAQVTFRFTDASGEEVEENALTDSLGTFSNTLEVEETTEVTITAAEGEASTQKAVQVSPDAGSISDLTFSLSFGGEEEREPGRPTDIVLQSQSTDAIRVQESGGTTIARLTFQVVDSTGQAIGLDRAVDVNFRFGQRPAGATLSPETVTTDGSGQATVNVSSGTTAGVVQIVAQTQRPDGTEFESKPVSLTIHGGLPNKCHFSLGPEQFNFPGLTEFGLTNSVRVFVGDKYGNPVVPGTSVYFSTNAGIIEGSAQTDDQGRGSVTLNSARPLPDSGVATVRAETVGTDSVNTIVDPNNCPDPAETGNENLIFDTIPVVFSGRPGVKVTPDSAKLDQTYTLRVWDVEYHNPLAPGTTIQVQAEGTKVKATGNTEVTLGDTAFEATDDDGFSPEDIANEDDITLFTFRVVEDQETDETGVPTIETVTITVEGPNGSLEAVLTPSGEEGSAASSQLLTPTRGATVIQPSPGEVIVRAPEGR
ncbi:MAG: carboxypeptidase regulatory-like domain-containing protein [Salinibacter sp.]